MRRFFTSILCLALLFVAKGTASAQSIAYTDGPGNLRAGPARDYPLVAALPPGTEVQIFGCTDDWTWCDVAVGPNRGWLFARHLDYAYQGRRVLIYGHGPTLGLPILTFSLGTYWDSYYHGRPWYGRRSYWVSRPAPPHRPIVRPGRPIHQGRPPAARPPHAGPAPGHRPPPSAHRPPSSGARPRPNAPPRTPQHDRGGDHHH